jgi:hypothetical protein
MEPSRVRLPQADLPFACTARWKLCPSRDARRPLAVRAPVLVLALACTGWCAPFAILNHCLPRPLSRVGVMYTIDVNPAFCVARKIAALPADFYFYLPRNIVILHPSPSVAQPLLAVRCSLRPPRQGTPNRSGFLFFRRGAARCARFTAPEYYRCHSERRADAF